MDRELEELVHRRSGSRCEYCRFPVAPFHIEHIVARKHGGATVEGNLALSCVSCNLHKGPNLSGIDPTTGTLVRLFNPRMDRWEEHFRWTGPRIIGVTPIGRTTVIVLNMNHDGRVEARAELIADGRLHVT